MWYPGSGPGQVCYLIVLIPDLCSLLLSIWNGKLTCSPGKLQDRVLPCFRLAISPQDVILINYIKQLLHWFLM